MSDARPEPEPPSAPATLVPPARSAWSRPAVWIGLGLAVALAAAFLGARPYGASLGIAFLLVLVLRAWLGPSVRPIAFAVGLALPLAVFVGVFVGIPAIRHRLNARPFDSAAWKAANDEHHTSSTGPRPTMIDDLLASGVLGGKTRAEVEDLLGPPLARHPDEHDRMRYLVGWTGVFIEIDPAVLVVEFGPDGRVARTSLRH